MPDTKAKPIPPLTADDGALDKALVDIEDKLSRWLEAFNRASAVLMDPQNWAQPAPPGASAAPPATDSAQQGSAPAIRDHKTSKPGADDATKDKAPKPAATTGTPAADRAPETAKKPEEHKAPAGPSATAGQAKPKPETLPSQAPLPGIDELAEEVLSAPLRQDGEEAPLTPEQQDECLLQSLDSQTRREIRIRRRLCNHSKSVRALLAEYKAEQQRDMEQLNQNPKRWWKKGKR